MVAASVRSPWYVLDSSRLPSAIQHTSHLETFGKEVPWFNRLVLEGVDKVQSTAMDGGGYFIGVKAVPAECPVGYPLTLSGDPVLTPTRKTSYCSGSSYSAFIEAMNSFMAGRKVPPTLFEALRMQEPNGGRREDEIKMWGWWNADGMGDDFALVQYSGIGERIRPADARPGDFMNISWKSGLGHSTVFLGYTVRNGKPGVLVWSSQKSTNGFGDLFAPIDTIKEVAVVHVTHPERIVKFDPATKVNKSVSGDQIDWKG